MTIIRRFHNDEGREIRVFEKEPHLRSSEEKWGVAKRRSKPEVKKLLVLGTGRCGTMFTTKALRTVGINVTHEKVGEDGTVSHYFLVDSDWYPMAPWQENQQKKHVGERRSDFEFEHTLHIVRDPRKAIPSMTKIFGSVTWQFYIDNGVIPAGIKNPMLRAMHLWLRHNELAQEQADLTYNLERYAQAWPAIMEILGRNEPYPAHLKPMNKTGGFRAYTPLTFNDMRHLDNNLANQIRNLARSYGYKE
jgi:hypothetical protein